MIRLHQFPPVFGRNVSPFTLKLETWLRLARLPYEVVPTRNPGRGPKGKLPFIEDDDGTVLGDSNLIIEHLMRTRGPPRRWPRAAPACAGARAATADRGSPLLHRRMEPLGGPRGLAGLRARVVRVAAATAPPDRRGFRPPAGAREPARPGLGRHSQTELYAMGRADLEAISLALHERPFFFGERPTTIDAIAYGCLDSLLNVPVETELKRIARVFPTLPLTARMTAHLDAI